MSLWVTNPAAGHRRDRGRDAWTRRCCAGRRCCATARARSRRPTSSAWRWRPAPTWRARAACMPASPTTGWPAACGSSSCRACPRPTAPVPPEQLALSDRLRTRVQDYLDERRMITVRMVLGPPAYLPVSVRVEVFAQPRMRPCARCSARVERALYRFIHPDGRWPRWRRLAVRSPAVRLRHLRPAAGGARTSSTSATCCCASTPPAEQPSTAMLRRAAGYAAVQRDLTWSPYCDRGGSLTWL